MGERPANTMPSESKPIWKGKSLSSLPGIALGIDIGTSHCSIAVWNDSKVELIRNDRNEKKFLSYVTFKDEIPAGGVSHDLADEYEMLFGACIFNLKRLVGRVDMDPVISERKGLPFLVQSLNISARPLIATIVNDMWSSTTIEEVLAILMGELKTLAESKLKRPVRDVVMTIPVSFSRIQIRRLERACAMAGLQVLRFMPEPTAVAMLYAQQQQVTGSITTIINMGAGFCDVAVTLISGGISRIKALAGSTLGGDDILLNTMSHLLPDPDSLFAKHRLEVEEIKKMGLLRVATLNAIHKLSSQPSVQLDVDLGNGIKICKVLDRKEFEEVNLKVFERFESLIKQCLDDAKVEADGDVILVGGCSNIPKLRDIIRRIFKRDPYTGIHSNIPKLRGIIRRIFKREPYTGIHPLEAAVQGAALAGAVASGAVAPFRGLDLLTIQATPLSIGIRANGNSFVPIIRKNTELPTHWEMIFTTVHDNQTEALIIVYEGDEKEVDNNHLLGYFKLSDIPPAPKGFPNISVGMISEDLHDLTVEVGVIGHPSHLEVRMPSVDDGHALCAEDLNRTYGSTLDLMTAANPFWI